jgi:large subunit ribosomal protein L9e
MYKMRLVHAHFPIKVSVSKDNKAIEIKNFIGGKHEHLVHMLEGCRVKLGTEVKDELIITGIDNQKVSLSGKPKNSNLAALINQSVNVGRKDRRKFLDGIYVSERTFEKVPAE